MKKLLINSILIVCFANGFAQNYSFSVRYEPFAELANPIQITGTIPWENPDDTLNIGFNFLFFATTIDHICFYPETQAGMLFGLPSTEDNYKLLLPFAVPLCDRALFYGGSSLSPISYSLEGVSPDRIFKLEFKNCGFAEGVWQDYVNYQLWLFEKDGKIEIHYGPVYTKIDEFAYNFETGPAISFIPTADMNEGTMSPASVWLSGNPDNPTMMTSDEFGFLDGEIPENTVYCFKNITFDDSPFILKSALTISPNPGSSHIDIDFKGNLINSIKILDVNGRIVYSEKAINSSLKTVNIENLKSGIYCLSIETASGIKSKKFVKK